jgi:hypothetical protein
MQNLNVLLLSFILVFIFIIGYKLNSYISKKRNLKKIKRGILLEEKAADFLIKHNYSINSHHQKFEYSLIDNNQKIKINLESDYIVTKNNKTYLVEVKSGDNTANIQYAPTRRQILEYFFATNFDGYLLLDMNKEEIHEIEFPYKKATEKNTALSTVLIFVGIIIIGSIFLPNTYKYMVCIPLGILIIITSSTISKWLS